MLRDILARIDARLEVIGLSESKAAKLAGLSDSAIRDMRRAVKAGKEQAGVSTRTISALAPVLQTTASWLLEGSGEEIEYRGTVPVVGYVGAGAVAHFEAGQGPFARVKAPKTATKDTVAVLIRGTSIGDFDGWYAYYDTIRRPVEADMFGRLCIVWLKDGRVMIKSIMQSPRPGVYHLESAADRTINDVEIKRAARVKAIFSPEEANPFG